MNDMERNEKLQELQRYRENWQADIETNAERIWDLEKLIGEGLKGLDLALTRTTRAGDDLREAKTI